MSAIGLLLVLLPLGLMCYAYIGYPLLLRLVGGFRPPSASLGDPTEWARISIVVPAYNEERAIRGTIESLLALDYPADRRQILVVSDASTDGTDAVVRSYADQGVELLRLPERGGKTAAENAALAHLTGQIIVNTDATIRILPPSLKPLIRVFQDPTVGVASGRDVSVGNIAEAANEGESGYVGYEMNVRSLETRMGSIVGASGCFYAIRLEVHERLVPSALSRDFASALTAREQGLRAVSVDEAICLVPRTSSLRREYRRKIRTMARGLETLWFKRHLLNPFRYRSFAWMLWSHKLVRWLVFLTAPLAPIGLALLSPSSWLAFGLLVAVGVATALGTVALIAPEGTPLPRLISTCGFVLASHIAGFLAWTKALRGELNPIWEPTRRST
ncbi:MAG: glycosyltransferase family 2 protein [Gemmatimonadales bacterium]